MPHFERTPSSTIASGDAARPPGAEPRRQRPRATVVHVLTVAASTVFLRGQVSFVRDHGLDVAVITSPGDFLDRLGRDEGIPVYGIPMTRTISPLQDLVSLLRLWRKLVAIRPDIVHAHTPKGGLLGMIAAALAGVPVRVYHLRGLPLLTASGPRAHVLRWTERTACALAHRVLTISPSLRDLVVDERLCAPDRIAVLANGSGNGVDAERRFRPLPAATRREIRERYGIPADARVVGFVGRLVRDKGVIELGSAWRRLREQAPDVHLLVVGRAEEHDPLPAGVLEELTSDPRVHLTGVQVDVAPFYSAMDVLAFPTYREGFGNVALEAAAMELPVVATRIPGCVDAVVDGETGVLVPARDADALLREVRRYLDDPVLRERHGAAGRRRVLADFRPETIWAALVREYDALLGAAGDPVPFRWSSTWHSSGRRQPAGPRPSR